MTVRVFVALALVALAAGCSVTGDKQLRAVVRGVTPAQREIVECEWGSSTAANEPKAYYRCLYDVRGKLDRVADVVQSRLEARAFTVSLRRRPHQAELDAARGEVAVAVDVLAKGFERSRFVGKSDADVPPGDVLVAIIARRLR